MVCNEQGEAIYEIENKPKEPLRMGGDDRLKFGGDYSFVRFAPMAVGWPW